MEEVIKIIEQLRNTSGTNDKLQILKDNKDNELLQKVLYYTYNPFKKYGMSEKTIKPIDKVSNFGIDIFSLLDILSESNINDDLRITTNSFLYCIQNNNEQELYICMLLKDLKIGLNAKSINKIWKNLIPQFNVQLAESYFKQKENYLNGREFILTTKLDGNRLVILKRNGKIEFYTRQGKLMEGLIELEEEAKLLEDNMVYDGELIAENPDNLPSDELFRVTMKKARKKGIKTGLIFNCFDMLPIEDFEQGICKIPFKKRKERLKSLLDESKLKHIIEVPILYQGTDESKILEWITWARDNDLEGVMINLSDAPYECKRSKGILKGKVMMSCDLKIVGFEEGEGNFKGTLGRINVEYKNNIVGVGSGFDLSTRDEIWNNQDKYLNKIAEIQYFEESTNQKDGKLSLRFPVFLRMRWDKDEPSYN